MKREFIFVFLFVLFFVLFSLPLSSASLPLAHQVFVIDAGHGGVDPGSVVQDIYEKEINLKISQFLKNELQDLGATVYMTREGDYDLASPHAYHRKKSDFDARISMIQERNPNYYISIHLNYLDDSRYFGPQVFYSKSNEKNYEIANRVQRVLNQHLHTSLKVKRVSSSLYMYSRIKVPGVLIECGFLSNLQERKKLLQEEYIQELAGLIARSFIVNT